MDAPSTQQQEKPTISRRAVNKLNDKSLGSFIAKAKAGKGDTKKLADGGGLFITLTPAGTPVWRIKYRFGGQERIYAVGIYPDCTLEGARGARDAVKRQLREGVDPVQAKKLKHASNVAAAGLTFEPVAQKWLEKERADWSPVHYGKSKQAFDRDVLPRLGRLPFREIKPAIVAGVIEAIIQRGARDTAATVLRQISAVFKYGQAKGYRDDNPAEPVHEILPKKKKKRRMPALLTFPALGAVMRNAEAAKLSDAVKMAHRLCAYSMARISNIVQAEWSEFHLTADVPVWIIPRKKMKSQDRDHDHKIVLSEQIAEELRAWKRQTGGKGYLFPSPMGGKHITRESIEKVYRVTLGLANKHSPHGWRAAFSTLARDNGFDREVVELTLDHIHDNDVARAYDRGERLEQRTKLMAWWGEQLHKAQRGADVVPLGKGKAA